MSRVFILILRAMQTTFYLYFSRMGARFFENNAVSDSSGRRTIFRKRSKMSGYGATTFSDDISTRAMVIGMKRLAFILRKKIAGNSPMECARSGNLALKIMKSTKVFGTLV